jgi:hypothetical protein
MVTLSHLTQQEKPHQPRFPAKNFKNGPLYQQKNLTQIDAKEKPLI